MRGGEKEGGTEERDRGETEGRSIKGETGGTIEVKT